MKNPHDPIGNQTRDLPVCSSVPQTIAPPRPPSPRLKVRKDFEA